jgi:hypothetical protein
MSRLTKADVEGSRARYGDAFSADEVFALELHFIHGTHQVEFT